MSRVEELVSIPGQLDWAALCSRGDSSRVVVIPGGPAGCGDPGERNAERKWLRGDTLPALEHDGLVDAFLEKAAG